MPAVKALNNLRHSPVGSLADIHRCKSADSAQGCRCCPDVRIVRCRLPLAFASPSAAVNFLDNFPDNFLSSAAEMASPVDPRYSDL